MRSRIARTSVVGIMLAGTALAGAMPAFAQQATEEAASDPNEIIVTAQRRSESLQKVPISLQALGEETLENRNVASFDDYAKMLPSVGFQSFGPGASSLSFRGINSGADGLDAGPPPTTGTYLDEIPITTIAFSPDIHVYDIARVEALAGPQGTLFGASSLSGTLRIITNKPDPSKFEGGWDASVNKFGKGDMGGSLEGFLNLPLSSNAALRIVGYYDKQGGYIDNIPGTRTFTLDDGDPDTNLTVNNNALVKEDFNPVESYGGRAALRVELDDNWTVTPQIIYQNLQSKGAFLYDPTKGDLNVTDYLPSYNDDEWWQAALTIEGKIGNWDLVYSGGYMKRNVVNEIDYSYYTVAYDSYGYNATYFSDGDGGFIDPTQRQYLNYDYKKLTQEIRFSSPADGRARITLGGFFQRQTNDIDAQYIIAGLNDADFANPNHLWFQSMGQIPGSPAELADVEYLKRLKRIDKDYALFAESNADVTDNLVLTMGIRFFWVNNSLFGFSGYHPWDTDPSTCLPVQNFGPWIPCSNVYTAVNGAATPRRTKEAGETHKLTLSWQMDSSKMLYATYSTGYRPGGVNRKIKYPPYSSDRLSNLEVGWKTSWAGGTVRWNGAIFYEKWKDMIFTLARPGDNGVNSLANVGGAKSAGIESDIVLRLGQLELSASGAYIDAKLTTDFCDFDETNTCVVAASKGTRLPVQPKFKSTVSARYNYTIGSSDAFVQATMNSQSGVRTFLLDADNAATGNTKGFTTFDFSAGIKLGDFSIEAFIENAFDKRGVLTRNTACGPSYCGPYARNYPIKPQFFGMKVGQRF